MKLISAMFAAVVLLFGPCFLFAQSPTDPLEAGLRHGARQHPHACLRVGLVPGPAL